MGGIFQLILVHYCCDSQLWRILLKVLQAIEGFLVSLRWWNHPFGSCEELCWSFLFRYFYLSIIFNCFPINLSWYWREYVSSKYKLSLWVPVSLWLMIRWSNLIGHQWEVFIKWIFFVWIDECIFQVKCLLGRCFRLMFAHSPLNLALNSVPLSKPFSFGRGWQES